jgi:hypothetical protein
VQALVLGERVEEHALHGERERPRRAGSRRSTASCPSEPRHDDPQVDTVGRHGLQGALQDPRSVRAPT